MSRFRWPIARALLALSMLSASGCSSKIPTYPTSGRVVYEDGKPMKGGGVVIWFESTSPPYHRASSEVDAEGNFALGFLHAGDGTMEGEHRIRFGPAAPIMQGSVDQFMSKRMHLRYLEYRTSGLKETIKKGENELVIKIERGPG